MTIAIKQKILSSAKKNILFLPHAIKQMSRPDRMISTKEIKEAVFNGEIIEEYPNDPRGAKLFSMLFVRKTHFTHSLFA